MFSNIGKYEPCGMFTIGHFMLMIITILGIFIALKFTYNKDKEQVHKIIKKLTISMCILEIIKIIYSINQNSLYKVNTYLPLYYCSMLLYAGLFSSFAKGSLKRVGDVFLATGSTIGGIIFIIFPSTSLPTYPIFHFLSIYSFLFHGVMIYLGILVNITNYITLKKDDIKYFAVLVGIMSIIALILNKIFDSNLMFISQDFPLVPINIFYRITNGSILFSLIMMTAQMTMPFYVSYYIINKMYKKESLIKQIEKNNFYEKEIEHKEYLT